MTASAAVRYQVIDAGHRRLVTVSPAGRPELGGPVARAARPALPGRVRTASSCRVARPVSGWMALKVAGVGILTAVGMAVAGLQFAEMASAEAPTGYVAGDPAWAHVSQP